MSEINFTNIGFDYGVKSFLMLVGDIEFSDLFLKADCRGVLYVFRGGDSEDEMIPVQMAFMFQNEEPAEKFMDNLLGRISKSNDKAIWTVCRYRSFYVTRSYQTRHVTTLLKKVILHFIYLKTLERLI